MYKNLNLNQIINSIKEITKSMKVHGAGDTATARLLSKWADDINRELHLLICYGLINPPHSPSIDELRGLAAEQSLQQLMEKKETKNATV